MFNTPPGVLLHSNVQRTLVVCETNVKTLDRVITFSEGKQPTLLKKIQLCSVLQPAMDCKKPSCCCLGVSVSGLAVILIAIATSVHFLSSDEPNPSGGPGSIYDVHKSIVEQISLLNLANQSGGGISWTWAGGAIAVLSALAFGYYMYHRKIKLPRRRRARDMARDLQNQDDRQREFIMNLMNRPSPKDTPTSLWTT